MRVSLIGLESRDWETLSIVILGVLAGRLLLLLLLRRHGGAVSGLEQDALTVGEFSGGESRPESESEVSEARERCATVRSKQAAEELEGAD